MFMIFLARVVSGSCEFCSGVQAAFVYSYCTAHPDVPITITRVTRPHCSRRRPRHPIVSDWSCPISCSSLRHQARWGRGYHDGVTRHLRHSAMWDGPVVSHFQPICLVTAAGSITRPRLVCCTVPCPIVRTVLPLVMSRSVDALPPGSRPR